MNFLSQPSSAGSPSAQRTSFLDRFCGIATLLVIGYHYFSRRAVDPRQVFPHGNALANLPIFSYGEHPLNRWIVRSYAEWAPTVGLMRRRGHSGA